MAGSNAPAAAPVGGNLDPRAIEALMQRAANGGSAQTAAHAAGRGAPSTTTGQTQGAPSANQPGATLPGAPASGPTLGGIPLPSGMAGQLAMALSQAMQSSGLFYESHLREFAFGRRSLTQMHNEPQAQAGQAGARSGAAEAAQPRAGAESTTTQSGQTSQAHSSSSQQAGQQGAQLSGALLGLDPSTHVLVRQQLETLANQSFAWQGEAWPGSDLEWDVRRREPQGQEETESWATQLKLTLPGLGEVRARLSLADTQLVMHLQAPDGAEVMADHTGLLRERLGLHGLQLSQFSISRDAADEGGPAT